MSHIIECDDCKSPTKFTQSYPKKSGETPTRRCERCHELYVRKSCNGEFNKMKPRAKRFFA